MTVQRFRFLARQRAHCIKREVIPILIVRRHVASSFRRKCKPSRMRDFTVPSGSPIRAAISTCVKPSRKASSNTCLCSAGRRAINAFAFPASATQSGRASSDGRSGGPEVSLDPASTLPFRSKSTALWRAITASQAASRPRRLSNVAAFRHNCRKTSCATSSAACSLRKTRKATP